ncbi:UNVERIFIED_CONTAM: transcription initiation factor IIB [Siphonaria sp. JEL0065]|nr:transcription initiation factor IIB [Siphonaria sp. JEL0065]
MDLNIKLICPHCKNPTPNIIENFRDGDLICGDCGLILGDRVVDTRSEWRTFADSEGDDPSRVGAAADTLLGDGETLESTTISRKDGGTGRSKDLSRIHNKQSDSKKSNALMDTAKKITALSERIGLEKNVTNSAIQLYKSSLSNSQLKSKPVEWVMAACIFLACKTNHVSRTFKEICGLTNVPKKEIGKLYKVLQVHFKKETKDSGGEAIQNTNTPDSFIRRFTGELNLPQPVRTACVQLGEKVYEKDILAGRSTISLVASVIYFIVCMSDTPMSAIEIARVSGCTESTLKTSYKILYKDRHTLVEGIKTAKGLEALPAI